MTSDIERSTRDYALHLALIVRRKGGRLVLRKRYGDRHTLGTFQTWQQVSRAVTRWGNDVSAGRADPLR